MDSELPARREPLLAPRLASAAAEAKEAVEEEELLTFLILTRTRKLEMLSLVR